MNPKKRNFLPVVSSAGGGGRRMRLPDFSICLSVISQPLKKETSDRDLHRLVVYQKSLLPLLRSIMFIFTSGSCVFLRKQVTFLPASNRSPIQELRNRKKERKRKFDPSAGPILCVCVCVCHVLFYIYVMPARWIGIKFIDFCVCVH